MDKSSTLPLPAPIETINVDDATTDEAAPSRLALLQRAVELGVGPRLSLDNIMMAPTDPVLAKKREPGVIERRARFRRVVKVGVGLCAGLCLFATAATALSSGKPSSSESSHATVSHSVAPASVVSEKQPLEVTSATKVDTRSSATSAAPPAAPRARWAKRR